MGNNHLSQKTTGILDRIYGKALADYTVPDQTHQKFIIFLLNHRRSFAIIGFALVLIGTLGILTFLAGFLLGFWSKGFGWFDWPFSASLGVGIVVALLPFRIVKELEQSGQIQKTS